jgi:hypothetical protein
MGVRIGRDDGDGLPRQRELTADDLDLLRAVLADRLATEGPEGPDCGRLKMLRHWFRPLADPGRSEADH